MIGEKDIQVMRKIFPFLSDKPVMFDVGANKGGWSDVVLDEYGDKCDLHLFEPVDKLLSFCEVKYEYRNNVKYNSDIVHCISGVRLDFHYFDNFNNELSSLYDGGEQWEGLPKKTKEGITISIDDYCERNNIKAIDCLKIDTEGNDPLVLGGCERLLKNDAVRVIILEYGEHYQRAKLKFDDVFAIAEHHGLTVFSYNDDNFNEVKRIDFKEDYHAEDYYLTKFDLHNSSTGGWNFEFIKNSISLNETFDLVLEIGAFEGLTTKFICETLLNKNDTARAVVIDPLLDYYYEGDNGAHPYFKDQYYRFLGNTRGLPIDLMRGKSEDELPKLHALRFCMCYVDGMHFDPYPYQDGSWCFAITKIGGYIIFDDYTWNDSSKASIDRFLQEFEGAYELIHKDYQVVIKKTSNRYNEITLPYYS